MSGKDVYDDLMDAIQVLLNRVPDGKADGIAVALTGVVQALTDAMRPGPTVTEHDVFDRSANEITKTERPGEPDVNATTAPFEEDSQVTRAIHDHLDREIRIKLSEMSTNEAGEREADLRHSAITSSLGQSIYASSTNINASTSHGSEGAIIRDHSRPTGSVNSRNTLYPVFPILSVIVSSTSQVDQQSFGIEVTGTSQNPTQNGFGKVEQQSKGVETLSVRLEGASIPRGVSKTSHSYPRSDDDVLELKDAKRLKVESLESPPKSKSLSFDQRQGSNLKEDEEIDSAVAPTDDSLTVGHLNVRSPDVLRESEHVESTIARPSFQVRNTPDLPLTAVSLQYMGGDSPSSQTLIRRSLYMGTNSSVSSQAIDSVNSVETSEVESLPARLEETGISFDSGSRHDRDNSSRNSVSSSRADRLDLHGGRQRDSGSASLPDYGRSRRGGQTIPSFISQSLLVVTSDPGAAARAQYGGSIP